MRLSIPIKPDEEGMLGRQCPVITCTDYFKVNATDFSAWKCDTLYCPYCGVASPRDDFLTKDQLEYAKSVATRRVADFLRKEFKDLERRTTTGQFSIGIKFKVEEPPIRLYFEKQSPIISFVLSSIY